MYIYIYIHKYIYIYIYIYKQSVVPLYPDTQFADTGIIYMYI